eukprot:6089538-Ditylum_brightwellii.AAC.1
MEAVHEASYSAILQTTRGLPTLFGCRLPSSLSFGTEYNTFVSLCWTKSVSIEGDKRNSQKRLAKKWPSFYTQQKSYSSNKV